MPRSSSSALFQRGTHPHHHPPQLGGVQPLHLMLLSTQIEAQKGIQECSVQVVWGFSLHQGFTNNTMAELWGIREALLRAWDNSHHRVCLQTNSLLATKWLNNNVVYSMEFSNLILDCKWLLNRD